MRLSSPGALALGAFALAGALPHLFVLLVHGMGPQRFQEQRMRSRLLPLLEPGEILTCRPRSTLAPCGWILAIMGMGAIPIAVIMFVGGGVSLLTTGSFLSFAAHEISAAAIAYIAFDCLRMGLDIFCFDCIVSDTHLYWYDGFWRATPHSCPILDVANVTTRVIWLNRSTIKMITVTLNEGRTLRLFGLESEREFFEALGFEYPPPKSRLWKSAQARRQVF